MNYEIEASILHKEENDFISTIRAINIKSQLIPYKLFVELDEFKLAGKNLVDKANSSKQLRANFDVEKLSLCSKGISNIEFVINDELSSSVFSGMDDILVKDSYLLENAEFQKLIIVFTTKTIINTAKGNPIQLKGITICFNIDSDMIDIYIDDSPPSKISF